VDEATQFYPLFAVFGQVAPIVSGYVMKYIVAQQPVDPSESTNTHHDVGRGETVFLLVAMSN